jgi:viroplasmin and RNaseH domain-containing protein
MHSLWRYPDPNYGVVVNHYSNPSVTYDSDGKSYPTGNADNNNADVLVRNRFLMSNVGDESRDRFYETLFRPKTFGKNCQSQILDKFSPQKSNISYFLITMGDNSDFKDFKNHSSMYYSCKFECYQIIFYP